MTSIARPLQQVANSQFAKDILAGLTAKPKRLSSKYFYDTAGDKLFQDIMRMPEYYLTDCEYEILETYRAQLLELIGTEPFNLIELGAGDGLKTKVLLQHFLEAETDFTYLPVDISQNALDKLQQDLHNRWPQLSVQGLQGDYFEVLKALSLKNEVRKVVLFLGSNIGNFEPLQALRFLQELKNSLSTGDLLLIGADLKKDPSVILNAYNDPAGITAAFNLNLLRRINRELHANFDLPQFKHWETYDPQSGATRSYLVSKQAQEVQLKALQETIHFEAWEAISVELSQKYSLSEVEKLAAEAGFQVVQHFFDKQHYFLDSLWVNG